MFGVRWKGRRFLPLFTNTFDHKCVATVPLARNPSYVLLTRPFGLFSPRLMASFLTTPNGFPPPRLMASSLTTSKGCLNQPTATFLHKCDQKYSASAQRVLVTHRGSHHVQPAPRRRRINPSVNSGNGCAKPTAFWPCSLWTA